MNSICVVDKTWESRNTTEGAGVLLKRAFGFAERKEFDPFLLLDEFRSTRPEAYRAGFPWHPHRGMETVTYMLKGIMEHEDSLGNRGVLSPGDVQWMTAGHGIIHQEMPGQTEGELWGLQLWVNLPAAHKRIPARYQNITRARIPEVKIGDKSSVRVISGEIGDARGPVQGIVTKPLYVDVSLAPGEVFLQPIDPRDRCIAYVLDGRGYFDIHKTIETATQQVVLFTHGEMVHITAGEQGSRFLLIAGRPIKEPIAWQGPVVMNTEEELEEAFREMRKGVFAE